MLRSGTNYITRSMHIRYLYPLIFLLATACNPYLKTSTEVNLRRYPDTGAGKTGSTVSGEKLKVLAVTGITDTLYLANGEQPAAKWYKVAGKDGEAGWLFGHYAEKIKQTEKVRILAPAFFLSYWLQLSPRHSSEAPAKTQTNFRDMPLNMQPLQAPALPYAGALLPGREDRNGISGPDYERYAGKVLRALRFAPITSAVEKRYFLPPGLLLCMVLQESSGQPFLPNSLDDGGIGLCHMQPMLAREFGLDCFENADKLRDEEHGKKLREMVALHRHNPVVLMHADDRFNPLLNLDAAGRMMATYMAAGANPGYGGPLRSAVARYAGRYNFPRYWQNLCFYMRLLHNKAFLAKAEMLFNYENTFTLATWLQAYEEYAEDYLHLQAYRQLPCYTPENAPAVMDTYLNFMLR